MKDAVEYDGVDLMGYTSWGCIDIVSAGTGEMKKDMVLYMLNVMMMVQEIFLEERRNHLTGIRVLSRAMEKISS